MGINEDSNSLHWNWKNKSIENIDSDIRLDFSDAL